MHNRFPVIYCFKHHPILLFNIVYIFFAKFDIFPYDIYIGITIWTILLMSKSNGMDEFMDYVLIFITPVIQFNCLPWIQKRVSSTPFGFPFQIQCLAIAMKSDNLQYNTVGQWDDSMIKSYFFIFFKL